MHLRIWIRRAVTLLLLLVILNAGISLALRGGSAHRYLTARLAESFGRPVEVRRFDFSFLDGLRLSASRVLVAEDPRFGQEYFLRAEQLTAGLRWSQVFAGRFEFGTLTFTRPSLNLVRASDGRWNIESWLPMAKVSPARVLVPVARDLGGRLYKIEVDGGRINFKSGADKRAFALVDVNGSVEQENPGRWRLDLEARPMRAGVTLQQSGILRVSGRIAGTSARLQPAELYAQWVDASIADMLRLANGKDYGVRGRLTLELSASSRSENVPLWNFALTGRATHVHRWDLAGRVNDPALNLKAEALWDPGAPRLDVRVVRAEAPHSELHGSGEVLWPSGIKPEFKLQTSGIDFADLFGWYRAFQSGVTEQTKLDGYLKGRLEVRGWPTEIVTAELSSPGVALGVAGLSEAFSSEGFTVKFHDGRLGIDPLMIHLFRAKGDQRGKREVDETLANKRAIRRSKQRSDSNAVGASRGEFVKLSTRFSQRQKVASVAIDGETSRAEDLLLAMAALGRPVNLNWALTGPVKFSFRRDFGASVGAPLMAGWIVLEDSRLRVGGLNLPLDVADARLEWKDSERRITLRSVSGLGAEWTGTISRRGVALDGSAPAWEFDLSADRLSAAELDRWLGPRARRGFLEKFLPAVAINNLQDSNRASGIGDDPVKTIHAHGNIAIDELEIAPVRVRKLKGRVDIDGRSVRLEEAHGECYGGNVSGSFDANLKAPPVYRADAQIERANLAMLAADSATLRERVAGLASASVHLTTRGIGREDLVKSLEGRGEFNGLGIQVRGLDLKSAMNHSGSAIWSLAVGEFTIRSRVIHIAKLRLKDGASEARAQGTVDFSHVLDLDVRPPADFDATGLAVVRGRALHVTGTLEAPQIESLNPKVEAKHASN